MEVQVKFSPYLSGITGEILNLASGVAGGRDAWSSSARCWRPMNAKITAICGVLKSSSLLHFLLPTRLRAWSPNKADFIFIK